MAESSLSANVASPRALKRSYSAVERTGAGTASSIAALIVQRPSPESETRPAKLSSAGSWVSAVAVRSSSQDAMTLPRRHTSAMSRVEIVTIELWIAQRRGFRIGRMLLLAGIRMAQNVHPFRVGRHDPVLDAVMDHLDEVPGAVRAAAEVAELGGAADFLPSWGARDISRTGRQRLEDRIEVLHCRHRSADHHAITTLQPPDTAAGSDIDVMDSFRRERFRPAYVVNVVRVAAVDENVATLEMRREIGDGRVDDPRRDHQPHRPRFLELAHEIRSRGRPDRVVTGQI